MPKCTACGEHVDCPDCAERYAEKQSNTLSAYYTTAREGFDEHLDYQDTAADRLAVVNDPGDAVNEIADTVTPHYTSDLLQLAANCSHMATDEPELGPAFDGAHTPTNIIAANAYDAIITDLHEYAEELREAAEEAAEIDTMDLLEGAEELVEMLFDGSPCFGLPSDVAGLRRLLDTLTADSIEYEEEKPLCDDRRMRAARLWNDATGEDCADVADEVFSQRCEE